jgi:glycosyltransferase involved in cell wall biosynthesis
MPHVSIVSPVYNAGNIIPELVQRIVDSVTKITLDYEIILVEDGGPDNSWEVIEQVAKLNPKIKGIKLSRNFGQHYAITAGLDNCKGDWIVVMDCDLQDRPEEIGLLYSRANEGFDVVLARREKRKDSFFKKNMSAVFYRTLGYLTGSEQDESVANFGIYSSKVITEISRMRESIRYFPTMVKWVGFKTAKVNVQHDFRIEGESSYNFRKLLMLALDIILAFSDKPIRILVKFGFLVTFGSFTIAIYTLINWLLGEITVLGYSTLVISIWFLSGVIIMTLGIIGLYVGKTFEGVKGRPLYIVSNRTSYD